jgi:hypothetical protein
LLQKNIGYMKRSTTALVILLLFNSAFITTKSFAQCAISLSFQKQIIYCYGTCTGAVTVTASGGSGPYQYLWNTGASSASINNLCAGYYTVTVSDGAGCSVTGTAQVTQRPKLITVDHVTNISCHGACDGSDSIEIHGGNAPYQVLWSTGATTRTISNLCPGIYTVTVTDSRGCTHMCGTDDPITEPDPLIAAAAVTNMSCGSICDGSALASATGGTPPYSFVWSDNSTDPLFGSLCAGLYTVTVTDAHNCSDSETADVQQGASLNVNVNVDIANAPGQLTAVASGGAIPYSYLWSNGSTSATISNLSSGTYTVTVSDINGCSGMATGTIVFNCGGFRTQTQGGWGAVPNGNNPGSYLHANFADAFPSGLTIGCNNELKLTSAQAVTDFLPSGSTPRALPAGVLVDPGNGYKNVLAGQVAALALSIRFDSYDASFGASGTLLSQQVINSGQFAGMTVQQVFDEANRKLGGCASAYSFADLNNVISSINENYVGGNMDNGFLSCPANLRLAALPMATSLGVYPNPATDMVMLTLDIENLTNAMVTVYNFYGQKISETESTINNKSVMLNASALRDGIYNVVVNCGSKNFTGKMMIRK